MKNLTFLVIALVLCCRTAVHAASPSASDEFSLEELQELKNANVTAASLNLAAEVSVFLGTSRAGSRVARLGHELIDDAIKILLDEHVIVTVEDSTHIMFNQ